jgi:hypothetical protein
MIVGPFLLRVNGFEVADAQLRRSSGRLEVVVRDKTVGAFAVGDTFELEVLDLVVPEAVRERLPNAGWRRVTVRRLTFLLRGRELERRSGSTGSSEL